MNNQNYKKPGKQNRAAIPAAVDKASSRFLPTTRREMSARGWDELDVLLVSGDGYVDHPAFGVPLLGRLLESKGYRVGIIAQPDWKTADDISRMGRPRLFCGVSAGCLDSMLAHYTAFRKKRHNDSYTPGGIAGARPNRAVIVYSNLVKTAFPGLPLVLGGIEASLRRAAHYDFWSDRLRRSILFDSRADIVLYGMAEQGITKLVEKIAKGEALTGIPGSAYISNTEPVEGESEFEGEIRRLPSYEEIQNDPKLLIDATLAIERQCLNEDHFLSQPHGKRYLIMTPPKTISPGELDALYELPFTKQAHPSYEEAIPALAMVEWSITAVRGCGGGCTFCSLAMHQGRRIRSRSEKSLKEEVEALTRMERWSGSISDVGGPTANAWGGECLADPERCNRNSCYTPNICKHLQLRQDEYLALLQNLAAIPGVKHLRLGSGLRHDLALNDRKFVEGLVSQFVGGQLKLAPEHSVPQVLTAMRKGDFSSFENFCATFEEINKKIGKEQYIVPYLISAFPGCTIEDMKALAKWFRQRGWRPQQVQCFIPTPGTLATAMYYAQCDESKNPVYVARSDRERQEQHKILIGGSW